MTNPYDHDQHSADDGRCGDCSRREAYEAGAAAEMGKNGPHMREALTHIIEYFRREVRAKGVRSSEASGWLEYLAKNIPELFEGGRDGNQR